MWFDVVRILDQDGVQNLSWWIGTNDITTDGVSMATQFSWTNGLT
jgi:hypothetical protein